MAMRALDYDTDGAVLYPGGVLSLLPAIEAFVADMPVGRAGTRLCGSRALADIAFSLAIEAIVAERLGPARPVRAILFDKTPGTNWALGWHQDRTVTVRCRHDLPGWGPWSIKAGIQHVEPPFAVIERMVTLRIHLDPVPADNAPLMIAPGSHCLGRVPEPEVDLTVRRCGTVACLAERGDVWAYATPILHASAASNGHAHRRVLQVDFSADELPPPLAWLGLLNSRLPRRLDKDVAQAY